MTAKQAEDPGNANEEFRDLSVSDEYKLTGNFTDIYAMPHDKMIFVRNGDVAGLKECFLFSHYHERSLIMLQDKTNLVTYFHFSLAIMLYEAIAGGLILEKGCALAENYLKELEHLKTAAEIVTCTEEMMLDFTEQVEKSNALSCDNQAVRRCQTYIYEHLCDRVSLGELAAHCNFSAVHLARMFKKETGQTIGDYTKKARMERAKYYLRHTTLSCTEIAHKLGYCSQSYFAKQFHEVVGATPLRWRSAFRNNHTENQ